ncbi:MAG: FGGY family carbohydrate kinase [Gammaproteobacteria bacterium]
MTDYYLALDQGGSSSRALVFNRRGEIAASHGVPIATFRNDQGHIDHDPEELVRSLREAIDHACGQLPPGSRIEAAGLATQRSSMVCWQRHSGTALSPVISWQDRRNAEWLERLQEYAAEIRTRTGLTMTPHYGASKMRWCLDNLPAVAAAQAAGDLVMGPLASFLTCRLLNEHPLVVDPCNAARTQLWDLDTRNWSPQLLTLFGIDAATLPDSVDNRFRFGTLATPLGPVPFTVLTGDQSAVPFAVGPLDPGRAYLNLGTGAFALRTVSGALPKAPRLLVSLLWSDLSQRCYALEGTVNGAGSALDWLAGIEGVAAVDMTRLADEAAELVAAGHSAGRQPTIIPLFVNGVSGLGSPYWISDLQSRFIDDNGATTAGIRALAVLESIAFLLQSNLLEMAPHTVPLQEVLITGGLSANEYLVRCIATLCGVPVARANDPEATARGLARLIAGDTARQWPNDRLVPLALTPVPGLEERYRRFCTHLDREIRGPGH